MENVNRLLLEINQTVAVYQKKFSEVVRTCLYTALIVIFQSTYSTFFEKNFVWYISNRCRCIMGNCFLLFT